MKIIFSALLLSLSLSSLASAPVLDCRIVRIVDSSYFEESLNTQEDSGLEISSVQGKLAAKIGGSYYSPKDGDQISLKMNERKEIRVEVKTELGDSITLMIERRVSMAKATLRVKERGQSARTIGYALCQKGIL